MPKVAPNSLISADRPLQDPGEDCLGYAPFASSLANALIHNSPDGLVVGINGAWGSGKSTAINFLLHYLKSEKYDESPIIIQFNPWWFSGQEDLTRRFFSTFESAVFADHYRRKKLVSALSKYSSAISAGLSSLPSLGAKVAAEAVRKVADLRAVDLTKLKNELIKELAKIERNIIVVLDDIDRLMPEEIRQLFRLVKTVADFPNVTYVLAFDKDVVTQALSSIHPNSGPAYLEKIVQMPFELPPPDRTQIRALFFRGAERIIKHPLDQAAHHHFLQMYLKCVDAFIAKPRDVVRLLNVISVTYRSVAEDVSAGDFVALEALRLFAPEVYEIIRGNPALFTGVFPTWNKRDSDEENMFHAAWVKQYEMRYPGIASAVQELFPRVARSQGSADSVMAWRNSRRACTPEHFPVYFRLQVAPSAMSRAEIQLLQEQAKSPEVFGHMMLNLLESNSPNGSAKLSSMLTSIHDELSVGKRPVAHCGGMIQAFCDYGDELSAHDNGLARFFLSTQMQISLILEAALGQIALQERLLLLRRVVEQGQALGILAILIYCLGTQHGRHEAGHESSNPLVDAAALDQLEACFVTRLSSLADSNQILAYGRLLLLLDSWSKISDGVRLREWFGSVIRSDQVMKLVSKFTTRNVDFVTQETISYKFDFLNFGRFFDIDDLPVQLQRFVDASSDSDPAEIELAKFILARNQARVEGRLSVHDL